MWLYWVGLFVHVIFILAVSELFFKSYLTNEVWTCEERASPAKRLVFIVADGLEESHLTGYTKNRIYAFINGSAFWGSAIGSHFDTQYSGIQALVSGVHVDPVTSYFSRFIFGEEPIDSFLNRSNNVFYIGSKNVYNYFNYVKKIFKWRRFLPESENRIVRNATKFLRIIDELSNVTVKKLEELFVSSSFNETLRTWLKDNKAVIFIHLNFIARAKQLYKFDIINTHLAVDTLISCVQSIVNLIERYYKRDEKTSFILSSNFGPEDRSKQKDHYPGKAILYPFIAWGAAININNNGSHATPIRQVDIASLASSLLGLSMPSNARGVVPLAILNLSQENKAEVQMCYSMQLYNLAVNSKKKVRFNLSNVFYTKDEINSKMRNIIDRKKYDYLDQVVDILVNDSIKVLKKNESFFKSIIWFSTMLSLLSWISLLLSEMLPNRNNIESKSLISFSELKIRMSSRLNNFNNHMFAAFRRKTVSPITLSSSQNSSHSPGKSVSFSLEECNSNQPNARSSFYNSIQNDCNERREALLTWKWMRALTDMIYFILLLLCFLLTVLCWPPQLIYYVTTPIILNWFISYNLIDWNVFAKEYLGRTWHKIFLYSALFLTTSFLMVKGFTQNFVLDFGIILILQSLHYVDRSAWSIIMTWFVSGGLMLLLGSYNVWDQTKSTEFGPRLSIVILLVWNLYAIFRLIPRGVDFGVTLTLLWQLAMSLTTVSFTDYLEFAGHSTPLVIKMMSWSIILSILFPALRSKDSSYFVLNVSMALTIPFTLLSTSIEPIFFLLLSNFMISWMLLEGYSDECSSSRQLNGDDARRALLFVFFCFFVSKIMGNDYSYINANIYSVRCLTENLQEPYVWLILILKPVLVYAMMTIVFLVICSSDGLKMSRGFNLVILIYLLIATIHYLQISRDKNGSFTKESLEAIFGFFAVNIFVIILLVIVLFAKYIYRLPITQTV